MTTPAKGFTLFPQLPIELRRAIWRQCLPYRVMEIDYPNSTIIAFEKAGIMGEEAPGWISNIPERWFSPATDIIHLNWDTAYDGGWYCFDTLGTPVSFFARKAAKAIGASITHGPVHKFGKPNNGFWGAVNEDFELLACRKDYLVTLRTIILHLSIDQAANSGLFGRLAEERIKLVGTNDK